MRESGEVERQRDGGFINPSGVIFNFGPRGWLLLQAAGSHHPGRPTSGAGAPGHSEGMGPDLAPALRGACGFAALISLSGFDSAHQGRDANEALCL